MQEHLHQDEFGHRASRCRFLTGKDWNVQRTRGITAEMIRSCADGDDLPQIRKLPQETGWRRPYDRDSDLAYCARVDLIASKHSPVRKGGPERLEPRRLILAFDMHHDCPIFTFNLHVAPAALSTPISIGNFRLRISPGAGDGGPWKGCGANAGDRRKKALGSLTRITRQALHSKSQARFCF